MKTAKTEVIESLKEKFAAVGFKTVDSKNRISLGIRVSRSRGKDMAAESYQIYLGDEGDVLLRPMVSVPSREAWIYRNPKAMKRIRQGLAEAGEGKTEKVKHLKRFLEKL